MSDKGFFSRWGDNDLDSADRYYSNTPGFININRAFFVISNKDHKDFGKMVGIDSCEKDFVEIAMMFKFDTTNGASRPSLVTIASIMGKERDTARRIKKNLIEIGVLTVAFDEERNTPDEYIFNGLVSQCRWWHEFWMRNKPDSYKKCKINELKSWLKDDGKTIFETEKNGLLKIEPADRSVTIPADRSVPRPLIDHRQRVISKEIELQEEELRLGGDNTNIPSPVTAGSPLNAISVPQKENSHKQKVLIDWVSIILKTTDRSISIEGWSWAQIFKTYKKECASAKRFQEITETFININNIDPDNIPSPTAIMDAFWGASRDGWLFQKRGKGFSKDLSFSPEGMLNHYPSFLAGSSSIFKTKAATKIEFMNTEDVIVDSSKYDAIMEKLKGN